MATAPGQVISLGGKQFTITPDKKRRSAGRRVVGWTIRKSFVLTWATTCMTAVGGYWILKSMMVGRRRHQWLPLWFFLVAAAPVPDLGLSVGVGNIPLPTSLLAWPLLALLAAIAPAFTDPDALNPGWKWLAPRRRFLSDKELLLVSRLCALVGVWHVVASSIPSPAIRSGSLLLVVLAGAIPWWWGRRVRESAPTASKFMARWETEVVPVVPKLAGRFIEFNDVTGQGVLELNDTKASEAAGMDEDVEWALGLRRGMVTLSNDPTLTVRQVRIVLSESPEGRASRLRMWQGPTLRDGRYHLATTETNQEVWVKLRDVTNGRARFFSWDGPTSTGKGGSMRITALEAALDPNTLLLIGDGKWGAGLPYLRAGAATYAANVEQMNDLLDRFEKILDLRAERYGQEGRDSFAAGPMEPHIFLMLDELPRILEKIPRVGKILNRTSAIGGSLGVTFGVAKQRSDAASWGAGTEATTTRTNVSGGGGRWVGPSDDTQGSRSNNQANDLDAKKLPRTGGWCYVLDGESSNPFPARGLWVPNRRDVADKGAKAPYGTVEDWLERDTIHPELRYAEHQVLLAGAAPSALPLLQEPAAVRESLTIVAEPEPAVSPGELIPQLLPEVGGITRSDLLRALEAHGVTITIRRVSQILKELSEADPPRAVSDNLKWRRAA